MPQDPRGLHERANEGKEKTDPEEAEVTVTERGKHRRSTIPENADCRLLIADLARVQSAFSNQQSEFSVTHYNWLQ
jgi:hypothetical protein